ncbi:MAG TPA: hypothetical protein VK579_04515, partial [Terriglobales bacterium]|nr:hypothetical protein [Terriglobales bacterium]
PGRDRRPPLSSRANLGGRRTTCPERVLCAMDKKEIESSKLTANFLLWIGAFMILLFVLLAHFVWKVF